MDRPRSQGVQERFQFWGWGRVGEEEEEMVVVVLLVVRCWRAIA